MTWEVVFRIVQLYWELGWVQVDQWPGLGDIQRAARLSVADMDAYEKYD